jgi:hypothetical protein
MGLKIIITLRLARSDRASNAALSNAALSSARTRGLARSALMQ